MTQKLLYVFVYVTRVFMLHVSFCFYCMYVAELQRHSQAYQVYYSVQSHTNPRR